MSNPYAAGGGGVHFEAKVVASALVAILCEAPIRGLVGNYATEARTQRADFGEFLDDLIISGVSVEGIKTKLHLQIKKTLTFTDKDLEWQEVVRRAWNTFILSDFDANLMRFGVGVGTYNARLDRHYQSVLTWAAQSLDGDHFAERIEKRDFSHQDKKAFVEAIRIILKDHIGREPNSDELWRFLKCLVIINFDFNSGEASRDSSVVIDRLRHLLPTEQKHEAGRIWSHLVAEAGVLIPAGGGASRQTLASNLTSNGLPTGTGPSFHSDIRSITVESQRALADIKSTIAGIKIHKAGPTEVVK